MSAPEIWGASAQGRLRSSNADFVFFATQPGSNLAPSVLEGRGYLFAVADGVGDGEGAREAARLLVEELVRAYYARGDENLAEMLREAIREANTRATQKLRSPQGAATLVAAVLKQDLLYLANVGDSRAYLLRGGQARQLTHDHAAPDGRLFRSLVGAPDAAPSVYRPLLLAPGDRILLTSDGAHRVAGGNRFLAKAAGHGAPRRAARRLLDQAQQRGSGDDLAAIIARPAAGGAGTWGMVWWQTLILLFLLLLALLQLALLVADLLPATAAVAPGS
jgi:serine/threonine protein phosphatase PrpC